jgi:hypothetical protein
MNWLAANKELIIALLWVASPLFGKLIEKKLPTLGKIIQAAGLDHFKIANAIVKKETGVDVSALRPNEEETK